MAEKYVVEGYEFDSLEEANEAKKELDAVKYMSRRTSGCSAQEAYLIYNKIIEGNLFKTEIGFDYLRALEEFLMDNGMFDVPEVVEEPVTEEPYENENEAASLLYNQSEEVKESPKEIRKKEKEAKKAEKLAQKAAKKEAKLVAKQEKLEAKKLKKAENVESAVEPVPEMKLPDMIAEQPKEIKPAELKKLEKQLKSSKDMLKTSIIFNIILAIGVAAMMYIASTSSNVNILNYETALQDKYSSWAEELKQKEDQLKEWEKSLEEQSKSQN